MRLNYPSSHINQNESHLKHNGKSSCREHLQSERRLKSSLNRESDLLQTAFFNNLQTLLILFLVIDFLIFVRSFLLLFLRCYYLSLQSIYLSHNKI